jgi:hypothetical protein
MTDKELLELAAKAAGVDVTFDIEGVAWKKWPSFKWNPLTDDGDALRLSVKLGMYLNIYTHPKMQQTNVGAASHYLVTEAHERNPYAATRRAIVRAAAEIGKSIT